MSGLALRGSADRQERMWVNIEAMEKNKEYENNHNRLRVSDGQGLVDGLCLSAEFITLGDLGGLCVRHLGADWIAGQNL